MGGKIDAVEWLLVQLRAKRILQRSEVDGELAAIQICHSEIDVARVAVPVTGVKRQPPRQQKQLRRHTSNPFEVIQADDCEPELAPCRNREDAAGLTTEPL